MPNEIVSRDEWLNARLALLAQEKELTRLSDEVARRRQELPWVQVDKTYRFDTDKGAATLKDLFGGRSQLLVYHFMFGPDYKAGCPSCSMIADFQSSNSGPKIMLPLPPPTTIRSYSRMDRVWPRRCRIP